MSPVAAAPYSQAIKAAGQIWVSGQLPADNAGKLIEGSITEKTRACCANVKAILEAGGSEIGKVVRVGVSLFLFASGTKAWWTLVLREEGRGKSERVC